MKLVNRADSGDADLATLEIVDGFHRVVRPHHQGEDQRRIGHGGNALGGRALDDEGEAGAGAERDVDPVGGHGLLDARIAAEARDDEIDAVPAEDAGALADVGGHERERLAAGLADAQGFGVDGRKAEDGAGDKRQRAVSDQRALPDHGRRSLP